MNRLIVISHVCQIDKVYIIEAAARNRITAFSPITRT